MKDPHKIKSSCHIKMGKVILNGSVYFEADSETFEDFLKAFYKQENLKYPKFFKMDTLSKLAFLGSEMLLKNNARAPEANQHSALLFSNRSSSLETDRKHQKSIAEGAKRFPSPALFVYTLPNIGMGEVAIRHKMQTENAFFVFPEFNAVFLHEYSTAILKNKKCKEVLCSWVEVDKDKRHGFFYLVAGDGDMLHSTNIINELYTQRT